MKYRQSFVSNSSSSSFILKDSRKFPEIKEFLNACKEDCYIYRGILYTTFVSDMKDEYIELKRNPYLEVIDEGGHGYPYKDEDYIKLDGLLGNKDVYISKNLIKEEDYPELIGISPKDAFDFYIYAKSLIEQDIESPEDMIQDFKRILRIQDED